MPLEGERYTLADVLAWDGPERMEIIDGEPVMLATPVRIHQGVATQIARLLGNYLEGKRCKVYAAPFAVRPFEGKDEDPADQTVQMFLLKDGFFQPYESYGKKDIAKVNALDGCFIELERVFVE